MTKPLRIYFITSLALGIFLALGAKADVFAAGEVTILGTSPNFSTAQAVDVAGQGIQFTYIVPPQSNAQTCAPFKESINQQTVSLVSPIDSRQHPLYTTAWQSKPTATVSGVNQFSFSLSIPQSGYELQPSTEYTLHLSGGTQGIRFSCTSQNGQLMYFYLPANGFAINFTTTIDDVTPVITEQEVLAAHNRMALAWITSEPATTEVRYGITPQLGQHKIIAGSREKHAVILDNLQPGTIYYYEIRSQDADGAKIKTSTGSIKTWQISPILLSDMSSDGVSLRWNTDPAVATEVRYGQTAEMRLGSQTTDSSTEHNFRLVHLNPDTKYYAQIFLKQGSIASSSEILSFSTGPDGRISSESSTLTPNFVTQFELSRFNFKDFPPDTIQASSSAQQASDGAVLGTTDMLATPISKKFSSLISLYPWLIWLWIPVIIMFTGIVVVWLLWRHEKKMLAIRSHFPTLPPRL